MKTLSSVSQLPGMGVVMDPRLVISNAPFLFNVERTPIDGSSYLASVGYDYDKGVMEVEFTDGSLYQYNCADSEIRDLLDADSRGQWFYYNDRMAFPYKKIHGPTNPSKKKE